MCFVLTLRSLKYYLSILCQRISGIVLYKKKKLKKKVKFQQALRELSAYAYFATGMKNYAKLVPELT